MRFPLSDSQAHRLFSQAAAFSGIIVGIAACVGCGSRSQESLQGQPSSQLQMRAETKLDARGIVFADVAQEQGLSHVWPNQPRPMRTNEAFGCGCAAFDFDNDGWQDILLVADPHPVLYHNLKGTQFVDVTEDTGLKRGGVADWTGCAVGDYDGDGRLDVLLTGFHRLALYRNLAGKRFEETTEQAGLDPANHNHWGASAGFMDLDGDAWLDVVLLNYLEFGPKSKQYCELRPGVRSGCPPTEYPPERGEIWRNAGGGRFELVPLEQAMSLTNGAGLVLAFADLDNDGRMDFYIGNDAHKADLLHNLGDMKFENRGISSGVAYGRELSAMAAMGADWGDFNRDGQLDLAVSNFDQLSFAVFRNQGSLLFTDVAGPTGVERATLPHLGFGTHWMDFDNDGWQDLAFVNGHVYDNTHEINPQSTYRQPTLLLRNEEGKKFTDIVPAQTSDVARPLVGRGSATLDFDNDGRMDLLAVDYEGPVFLLHNRSQTNHHWLKLSLRGAAPNRFAYGTRAIGRVGKQIWVADVSPASSYLSSKDPRIHWGLGTHDRLDSVTIRWPSGREFVVRDVAADQILTIDETAPTTDAQEGEK